jgi:hypothetical protein
MEIRPLLATDAPAIHRSLLRDREVAAWFRSSGPFTLAECEEMVTRKVAHRAAHCFGGSLFGMTYEKSFDFHGEPHVLYRKPSWSADATDGRSSTRAQLDGQLAAHRRGCTGRKCTSPDVSATSRVRKMAFQALPLDRGWPLTAAWIR